MTTSHTEDAMLILRLYGPLPASRIGALLSWPAAKTYATLATLDAQRLAVMVKAEKGRHASVRREWRVA